MGNLWRSLISRDGYGRHRAYLLRCWREGDVGKGNGQPWRFAVEEVFGERRRQGFGSLDALLAFLKVELACELEE